MKKLNISQDELVEVGYVGRFEEQKKILCLFVNYLSRVQKRVENVKLLLVGDGSMYEQMVEFLKEKGLFQKVIFTGVVENVNDYLQTMDCFILPSFLKVRRCGNRSPGIRFVTILSDHVPKEAAITDLHIFFQLMKERRCGANLFVKHVSVKAEICK